LLDAARRPPAWLCLGGVAAVIVANWLPQAWPGADAWTCVSGVFAAVVLIAFLTEMATFQEPGNSVVRIALAVWLVAYLGLLPSFLAQLRWRGGSDEAAIRSGSVALALAMFVPKCCDTGAYFTGRLLGRHRMTPTLSPKKTWEGAAGGLVAAVLGSWGINSVAPVIPGGWLGVIGFGVTIGIAGILGDLAESLIKRDCQKKDASQAVPGFGGVLDVVDSIVFCAPLVYWWLRW
jgi:phosphatidate cytidylyltransferase